jgi:2-polyprenyl-3-methyl-5-hydroxy-6-metoxy-1,4-benzoquinol methylase
LPRIIRPELLDHAGEEETHRNLADLRRINRWFGAHQILAKVASRFYTERDQFSVLDVGAASGDMGNALKRSYPHARVTSLDQRVLNMRDTPAPKLAADAFHLPFAAGSFDVVMCHLFLHHFEDGAVTQLLASMKSVARRGVIVVDLERHFLARAFLPATRWLFRWNSITLHDGPVSVDAGFKPDELRALAVQAGLSRITVRRHVPWFRLSLTSEQH